MAAKRENFASKTGFILACAGSAIGLGNIWMFPWRLGQHGGAAFLILYLFFVYILGITGLIGEYGLGRWAGKGSMGAFEKAFKTRGWKLGRLFGAYPTLVLSGAMIFYAIVSGWVLKYFYAAVTGEYIQQTDPEAYFGELAGQPSSIFWTFVALALTGGILLTGVSKGIERINKIFMPGLFIVFVILAFWSLSLDGAGEGLRHLFVPDWSVLGELSTWGAALGQAFFTLSLVGSAMVVYGSYLDKDSDIPSAAIITVSLDTLAALLAALIIMPAVFAYGLDPAKGPPLLFITMIKLFVNMPAGRIFCILFFMGIVFAAISSMLNIMEVSVEALMDQFDWSRKTSVSIIGTAAFACTVPVAVDMGLFENIVNLFTIYLTATGAVMAAVAFFWIYPVRKAREEINIGASIPLGRWWEPLAKYVFTFVASLIVVLQIFYQIG